MKAHYSKCIDLNDADNLKPNDDIDSCKGTAKSTNISMDGYTEICRACTWADDDLESLFTTPQIDGIAMAQMYSVCINSVISIHDGLPSQICGSCRSNLKIAYDFVTLVQSSETFLRNELNSKRVDRKCIDDSKKLSVESNKSELPIDSKIPNDSQQRNDGHVVHLRVLNKSTNHRPGNYYSL